MMCRLAIPVGPLIFKSATVLGSHYVSSTPHATEIDYPLRLIELCQDVVGCRN